MFILSVAESRLELPVPYFTASITSGRGAVVVQFPAMVGRPRSPSTVPSPEYYGNPVGHISVVRNSAAQGLRLCAVVGVLVAQYIAHHHLGHGFGPKSRLPPPPKGA